MRKKTLALLLAAVMVFALFPAAALAAQGDVHKVESWSGDKIQLLGGTPEWVFFKQGNPDQADNGIAAIWTSGPLSEEKKDEYFKEVMKKDPSVDGLEFESMYFFSGTEIITNGNQNTGKYQVSQIDGVWYVSILNGKLSHFVYKEGQPLAQVEVTLDVKAQDFHNVFKQDFYNVLKQDFHNVLKQNFYNVLKQDFHNVYIPVFEKDVSCANGTLVTRLDYSGATAKATPTNGGAFKNGHTYVAVDVAAASAKGGVWYAIADSSFNSNGKKTPAEYNRPVLANDKTGYQYNVKIAGGKLTISFDDRLVSASVGAYVVGTLEGKNGKIDADKAFPGNAPKHYKNSVTVDVPVNNGTVYLYFHLDGLKWYTTGDYEFIKWDFFEKVSGDPYFFEKVLDGNPYFFEKVLDGDPYFFEKVLDGDPYFSEKALDRDPYSVDDFPGVYTVTLMKDGIEIGTAGLTKDNTSRLFDNLEPGNYTIVLSLGEKVIGSEAVTLNAGGKATVAFTDAIDGEQGADVIIDGERGADEVIDGEQGADEVIDGEQGTDLIIDGEQGTDVYLGSEDPEDPESIAHGIYTPPRP